MMHSENYWTPHVEKKISWITESKFKFEWGSRMRMIFSSLVGEFKNNWQSFFSSTKRKVLNTLIKVGVVTSILPIFNNWFHGLFWCKNYIKIFKIHKNWGPLGKKYFWKVVLVQNVDYIHCKKLSIFTHPFVWLIKIKIILDSIKSMFYPLRSIKKIIETIRRKASIKLKVLNFFYPNNFMRVIITSRTIHVKRGKIILIYFSITLRAICFPFRAKPITPALCGVKRVCVWKKSPLPISNAREKRNTPIKSTISHRLSGKIDKIITSGGMICISRANFYVPARNEKSFDDPCVCEYAFFLSFHFAVKKTTALLLRWGQQDERKEKRQQASAEFLATFSLWGGLGEQSATGNLKSCANAFRAECEESLPSFLWP